MYDDEAIRQNKKFSHLHIFFHLKYGLVNPCDFSPGTLLVTLL